MTLQGHIVVPTTHEKSEVVLETVTGAMATRFGGFSTYNGEGGWDGENGIVTEDHVRIVVNFDPEDDHFDREAFEEWLRIESLYIKDELSEDAVLFEVHEMTMELV